MGYERRTVPADHTTGGGGTEWRALDTGLQTEVDGSGALPDLRFTREIAGLTPTEFERAVIDTARVAAVWAFTRRAALINE
ncbi:hypothetical protein ACFYUD_32360 [Nocardia tengchongensis]|uniref:hypothetical protein n=1 Tax=Nocardia tengchongensis TaxID=2055889 RepID=UPI003677BA85